MSIIIGILIIAAGIFLLVSPDGNSVLKAFVGIGVFVYCLFNIYKAVQHKNDNSLFIPYLAHGLLDLVLLLLLITINEKNVETPVLVEIIVACWLIVFGFFDMIRARRDSSSQHGVRNGSLLILAGLGVLIIPLLLGMHSAVFLGIVAIVFGVIKVIIGLVSKVRIEEGTSGGRPGLF